MYDLAVAFTKCLCLLQVVVGWKEQASKAISREVRQCSLKSHDQMERTFHSIYLQQKGLA